MSLPFLPLYVTDYKGDTAHLTIEEHGAFICLLMLCWQTPGCSIPDDPAWIKRRLMVDDETFARSVEPVISEFFKRSRKRLYSPRLSAEHLRAKSVNAKRKKNGQKGGIARNRLKSNETEASPAKARLKQPDPEPEPYPDYIKSPVSNTVTRAQGAGGMEDENEPGTTGRSETPDDGEGGGMASATDGDFAEAGTGKREPGGNGGDPWENIRLTAARRDIARANGIAADEIDGRFADFITERQASAAMVREPDEDWRRYCGKHGRHRSPNGTSAGGRSRAAEAFREALARRQAQRVDMGRGDGDAAAWIAPAPNSEDDYGCGEAGDPVLRIVGGEG